MYIMINYNMYKDILYFLFSDVLVGLMSVDGPEKKKDKWKI